jgi:adenosylmethionine-8-amino-7-oxononanoate aminotransferase
MAAVLTTNEVYQAFYDDYATLRAFLHSHTYTGNPLACAAANATLDIFAADKVLERNRGLARHMASATAGLRDHPHVAEVRQTGMILAIEMVKDKRTRAPYPRQERRGQIVYRYALDNAALLRPLGDVIYFMPPYVIREEEIDHLARVAEAGIARAAQGAG